MNFSFILETKTSTILNTTKTLQLLIMVFVLLINKTNHCRYDMSTSTTFVGLYKTKEGATRGAKKYILNNSLSRECLNDPFAKEFGNFYGGNTYEFKLSDRTVED